MNDMRFELGKRLTAFIGRLLCALGFHDFRVVEVRFGFGAGNHIEKVQCRRCSLLSTRRS